MIWVFVGVIVIVIITILVVLWRLASIFGDLDDE